jgi:mono/diheme cytochrome c family protein
MGVAMRVRALMAALAVLGVSATAGGVSAQQPASVRASATPVSLDAGKRLFTQRCSICHLPPLAPGEPKAYARALGGFVKGPETEAAARLIVERGVPQRMPGFRYGLEPGEIDSIVRYLSTLK